MATFPVLSTGAVAQYPLESVVRFETSSVSFLNGDSQRYRLQSQPLRRWIVSLRLLTDAEVGSLIAFAEQQGTAPFQFTDPATGHSVPNCVLGRDNFAASALEETNSAAMITIEEIP